MPSVVVHTQRREGPIAEWAFLARVAKLAAQADDHSIARLGGSCDPESYGMRFGSP